MNANLQDSLHPLFPTLVGESSYPRHGEEKQRLLEAIYDVRRGDEQGEARSSSNYHAGYTSYFSRSNLSGLEPFRELAAFITDKANKYAEHMRFDLQSYRLLMTTLWININPKFSYHADHIHPYSHISGVFYVSCSEDSGDIVFKDPRPVRTMAMPPTTESTKENTDVITLHPQEGKLLLFPAWLTHGVEQNTTDTDRVSMSFNFDIARREGVAMRRPEDKF